MMSHNELLSERLRPQSLDDLILPERILSPLKRMMEGGSILNLILYGKAGTGKTSAAMALTKTCSVYDASSTLRESDSVVQERLEAFASSVSIDGVPKVVLINEADRMSRKLQTSLLDVIEKCQKTTRFVFTTNNIGKIIGGIQSRCMPVSFDINVSDSNGLFERALSRYENVLSSLGYQYDPNRLRQIVSIYYPDYRSIANRIQFDFHI